MNKVINDPKIEIIEGDASLLPTMQLVEDDTAETPVDITNAKVFIFLEGSDPVEYVNGRNGTVNTGLSYTANKVTFSMSADDTAIVSGRDSEWHKVRFELYYGTDRVHIIQWRLHVTKAGL